MICVERVDGLDCGRKTVSFRASSGKWVSRSYARLLGAIIIGRPLRRTECVHHVNGDPADDRFENLEVLTWGEHALRHPARPRFCAECGRTLTHCRRSETENGDDLCFVGADYGYDWIPAEGCQREVRVAA